MSDINSCKVGDHVRITTVIEGTVTHFTSGREITVKPSDGGSWTYELPMEAVLQKFEMILPKWQEKDIIIGADGDAWQLIEGHWYATGRDVNFSIQDMDYYVNQPDNKLTVIVRGGKRV